jgi:hypothetical protein
MNNETYSHTHVNHGKFDAGDIQHSIVGVEHLVILAKKKIGRIIQAIRHCDRQIVTVVREFQKLANIHDVWYQNISGLESATYRVESQLESASHYLFGMVAGLIVAVVFGVYFSVTTMLAGSVWLLFMASLIVAVVISVVTSVILRAALGASPVNPGAIKRVNLVLVIAGISFLCLLAFFAWLRFQSVSPLVYYLPHTMVGLELMAIIFAGACEVGYRMYRWSGILSKRHHNLLSEKEGLQDQLTDEYTVLRELEYRLKGQQYIPSPPGEVTGQSDNRLLLEAQNPNGNSGKRASFTQQDKAQRNQNGHFEGGYYERQV